MTRVPIDVPALRRRAQSWYLQVWTQRVDVTRPGGEPTFDGGTGLYADNATTVVRGMAGSLSSVGVPEQRDVAGDGVVLTRLEFRHDPAWRLRVDDRVTFTVHDDETLVGTSFYVVGVSEPYEHVYGMVYLQRTEPDSGA